MIEVLFTGGSSCTQGCYVSHLLNDYQLTSNGVIQQMGEYTPKFEAAPFLSGNDRIPQIVYPGQKSPDEFWFFVQPGSSNFVLTYNNKSYNVPLE